MTARQFGFSACAMAILLLGLSLFGGRAVMGAADAPQVMGQWVRLPAVAGRPAAGYFMVHGSQAPDTLVGVASPLAERIELHSMVMEGGVMKMRAEPSFTVPARGTLTFAPGGNHLMLFGLKPGLKPGQKIPLVFSFGSGMKLNVEAEVRGVTDAAPAADSHQH
jgi:copper(I)-binding protein